MNTVYSFVTLKTSLNPTLGEDVLDSKGES